MSRPRLTIGTVGDITIRKVASGRFEARTRYRDWDGKTRQVQSSGATAAVAERGLKARLVELAQEHGIQLERLSGVAHPVISCSEYPNCRNTSRV